MTMNQAKRAFETGKRVTVQGFWTKRNTCNPAFNSLNASLNGGYEVTKFGSKNVQINVEGKLIWATQCDFYHNAGRFVA